MRKLRVLIMICGVFLLPSQFLQSQVDWDYPLKPGMQEWKDLPSHKAMVDACQVPANILPDLTTDRLVELCLSYPLFFTMEAFNNLQVGFDQVSTEFNGFQELFKREDVCKVLIKLYQSLDPNKINDLESSLERGLYKQKIFFTEFLLSQKIIIDNCSEGEIRLILSESLKKLDAKTKNKYSSFGILTTPLLMCRVLEFKKYNEFENLTQKNDSYLIFSKSVQLRDLNMIDELKTYVVNYLGI